jgi:hypothetical protein
VVFTFMFTSTSMSTSTRDRVSVRALAQYVARHQRRWRAMPKARPAAGMSRPS